MSSSRTTLRCRLFGHKITAAWRLSKPDADKTVVLLTGRPDGTEDGFTCKRRRCHWFARGVLK
jgi:hypothetical protein